jgi:excisionase family DNA binding protein
MERSDMTTPGWLTLEETAKTLNVSDRTIRRWLKRGKIHGELRAGPHGPQYYFPRAQIRALRDQIERRGRGDWDPREERLSETIVQIVTEHLREDLGMIIHHALEQSHAKLRHELARLQTQVTRLREELKVALEDRRP